MNKLIYLFSSALLMVGLGQAWAVEPVKAPEKSSAEAMTMPTQGNKPNEMSGGMDSEHMQKMHEQMQDMHKQMPTEGKAKAKSKAKTKAKAKAVDANSDAVKNSDPHHPDKATTEAGHAE